MPNYKTKEEYWRAQGRYALAVVVRRLTYSSPERCASVLSWSRRA